VEARKAAAKAENQKVLLCLDNESLAHELEAAQGTAGAIARDAGRSGRSMNGEISGAMG
jgi:hypothetical protein